MSNVSIILEKVLDSNLSAFVRKESIRKLGRAKKGAELTAAVIRLLNDIEDENLQREVIDLAVKLAIQEAVNQLIPISVGNGLNARFALNAISKIGGQQAYNHLKEVVDKQESIFKNDALMGLRNLSRQFGR